MCLPSVSVPIPIAVTTSSFREEGFAPLESSQEAEMNASAQLIIECGPLAHRVTLECGMVPSTCRVGLPPPVNPLWNHHYGCVSSVDSNSHQVDSLAEPLQLTNLCWPLTWCDQTALGPDGPCALFRSRSQSGSSLPFAEPHPWFVLQAVVRPHSS